MQTRRRARRTASVWAVSLVAVLLVGLGAWAWWLGRPAGSGVAPSSTRTSTPSGSGSATRTPIDGAVVVWVSDGDTLDATIEGVRTRLRLINIDAPEVAHDGVPAQCLAGEAKSAVLELAPVGSRLRLVTYGSDRFGRTLAAAFLADGRLLNAEIVRRGLAGPLVVDHQAVVLAEVRAAQAEAAKAAAGLHGVASCSIPGRLRDARARLDNAKSLSDPAQQRAGASQVLNQVVAIQAELDADARDALVQGLTDTERRAAVTAASDLTLAASRLT